MANETHLSVINQGIELWNQWRIENPDIVPDFSHAKLKFARLIRANLRNVNFSGANLEGANFIGADLRNSNFVGTNLENAFLRTAQLQQADLRKADLRGVDFEGAKLCKADLSEADLRMADCRGVNFSHANFRSADLEGADLRGTALHSANFHEANLTAAQVIGANFSQAILTGACVEDWNISSSTRLSTVICQYVYLRSKRVTQVGKPIYDDRAPLTADFKPGEFAALHEKVLDTVDLIFTDGLDWHIFFQTIQDLRCQFEQAITIQAIEKKARGAFIVRLEVSSEFDKSLIEQQTKELYASRVATLEHYYSLELKHREEEASIYRQQSENLMRIIELFSTKQSVNPGIKYDLRGAQFSGSFAETVKGNQIGGINIQ